MYFRNLEEDINRLIDKEQSALIFGPRQVGKTTLIKKCLSKVKDVKIYLLQDPKLRRELEKDPSLIIRQVEAQTKKPFVFIDEAQKVPELFDSAQYLLDEKKANFLITGSSARKLKRKGANLLPGRVKSFHLSPMCFNELNWIKGGYIPELAMKNLKFKGEYNFDQSLVFGSLPGIISQENNEERKDFLKAYAQIYLEEEIRAEALSRKIGAFSRFLELAAVESGTSPNLTKLSMESGVSSPAIKEFYSLLEDTLIVERIDPYLKNARKRILSSSRYYFFDIGVRNVMARMPLTHELINSQKGTLFEHAVILEIKRRIYAKKLDYKVYYWRTAAGAEVDCVIDLGEKVIPIEIKSSKRITLSELKGLNSFLEDYSSAAQTGYVITMGDEPERLTDKILAIPWNYL